MGSRAVDLLPRILRLPPLIRSANLARYSWIVPSGQIHPQNARPATRLTPSTLNRTEKFRRLVVLSVCPVVRYTHKVSIPPKGQKESKPPPLDDSPGRMWRRPIKNANNKKLLCIQMRVLERICLFFIAFLLTVFKSMCRCKT